MEIWPDVNSNKNDLRKGWSCGMGKIIYCFAGILLLSMIIFGIVYTFFQNDEVDKTLMQVHVIFRHADKFPHTLPCFVKDPYKDYRYFPYGPGALTPHGRRMAYRVGEILKLRYSRFLGSLFYPSIVDSISTNYERTQMTLLLVLAGLFPPTPESRFKEQLFWQPIPYKFFQKTEVTKFACRNESALGNIYNEKTRNLFSYIQENIGCNITNLKTVYFLKDVLKEYTNIGLPLPEWTRNIWPNVLFQAEKDFWNENYKYNRTSLIIGELMNLVHKNIEYTVKKKDDVERSKIFLYSMHQSHITSLLSSFGHYYGQDVNYLSQFVIEVHKLNETNGVKIFFKNGPYDNFIPLTFKNYSSIFPLEEFNDFIKNDILAKTC